MLNGLADSDATVDHRLIVGQVEHEQVAFVAEDTSNGQCAFLADTAVS